MVPPSEYLPQIWGDDFAFESDEQTAEIMGLLMRHWNTIAIELHHTLDKPDVYLPVLLEGDDGIAPGNDWAHGFMRGVETSPASWGELIHDEDHGGPMLPIMMLHYEPAPQMRPPPIPPEKREELLQTMIAGLTHIYRYFEPHRGALESMPAHLPMRRDGRKASIDGPSQQRRRQFRHYVVYRCYLAASSWMTVHTFCSATDFSPDKRTASIRSFALPNRWPSSVKLP